MKKIEYEYGKHSKLFPYLFICLAVLIVYLPSFTGEFILDDIPLVENNEYLREWQSIGSYLSQEDGYDKLSGKHTGYYRPLINLSYTLDYKVWGLFAPGFRVTNLMLHLFACFSIFVLYNQFFKKNYIALMLVLVFALHPVNTETVSWVSSRNNILSSLFGILSLIYYIRSYKKRKYGEYILSIVFFAFAVFSKEFGLMLLPIFFLYQRIFNNKKESICVELREYIPFILISAIYFILRQSVTGSLITPSGFSDVFTRIYNAPYVLFLNFKLILLPFNLHSFIIKYPEGLFNVRTIACLLCFALGIILMWVYRKNRIVIFSFGVFLVAIFPVLGIIKTSAPSLIAMRWLYFPMPFILILLAMPLKKLYEFNHRLVFLLFIPVIFYLGFNSYTLNRFLWHSEEDFFKQEILQFENYFYADGLASIYVKEKKPELAMAFYEKNIKSGVKRISNYLDYADLLLKKGDPEKSLEYLEEAQTFCFSNNNLGLLYHIKGLAYLSLNNLKDARKYISKGIKLSPKESVYWENMGVVQGRIGDHKGAIKSFKKAIRLGTESSNIYKNLVNGYILNNECQAALKLIYRINKGNKNAELNRLLKDAERCLEKKDSKY